MNIHHVLNTMILIKSILEQKFFSDIVYTYSPLTSRNCYHYIKGINIFFLLKANELKVNRRLCLEHLLNREG